MKIFFLPLSVVLCLCCGTAFGQREITLATSYQIPLGNLKPNYGGSPCYELSYLKGDGSKKKYVSWGVMVGYMKLRSVMDTVYYPVETVNGPATGAYYDGDYTMIELMMTHRVDHIINKHLEFCYTFDFGFQYTQYAYYRYTVYNTTEGGEVIGRFALAPKIGFTFPFNDTFSLAVYGGYTPSLGYSQDSANIFMHLASAGTRLSLRF